MDYADGLLALASVSTRTLRFLDPRTLALESCLELGGAGDENFATSASAGAAPRDGAWQYTRVRVSCATTVWAHRRRVRLYQPGLLPPPPSSWATGRGTLAAAPAETEELTRDFCDVSRGNFCGSSNIFFASCYYFIKIWDFLPKIVRSGIKYIFLQINF